MPWPRETVAADSRLMAPLLPTTRGVNLSVAAHLSAAAHSTRHGAVSCVCARSVFWPPVPSPPRAITGDPSGWGAPGAI